MMDGVGGEVTQKIRAAIKAKLVELGAYVDDELPDYIMVMVANRRSRSQMNDELTLFLNTNTKLFTSWLHTVLDKLQQVTVSTPQEKSDSDTKKSSKRKRSLSKESSLAKISKPNKVREKHKKSKTKKKKKDKKVKKEKDKSIEKKPRVRQEQSTDSDWSSHSSGKIKLIVEPEKPAEIVKTVEDVIAAVIEKPVVDDVEIIEEKIVNPSPPVETSAATTILAPTRELLKQHDELTADLSPIEPPRSPAVSQDSQTTDEIRRQLLLSRAKRKLEERYKERRMLSNSPELIVIDRENEEKGDKSEKPSREPSVKSAKSAHSSRSSNVSDHEVKKKRPRKVGTQPEIASVVKVKPREFMPPEKQANKHLILKAVAAAERSVASAPVRKASPHKPQNHYTNLAITLDNSGDANEDNFISSKVKDKNTKYIEWWLDDVEDKRPALISPDQLVETEDAGDSKGAQILVTVDGLRASSTHQSSPSHKVVETDVNKISNRFASLHQPDIKHTFTDEPDPPKKQEQPLSKNKLLIAQLSLKFANIDSQPEEPVWTDRKREFTPRTRSKHGRNHVSRGDDLVRICRFGPRCKNSDCRFRHPH